MHRIALLGVMVMASTTAGVSSVHADNFEQPVSFELSCEFRSQIKGFEQCHAFSEVFVGRGTEQWFEEDQKRQPDRVDIEADLTVTCNDQTIADGDAEVDVDRSLIRIESEDGPAVILPKKGLEIDPDGFVISAWLKLKEGKARGFCEVSVRLDEVD